MSTKWKIASGLIILLIVIAGIGIISMVSNNHLIESNKNIKEIYSRENFYLNKTIDHLKWDRKLMQIIFIDRSGADIETDPNRCSLGKWFYSYINSDDYGKLPAELQNNIINLEKPHKYLHKSAIKIVELVNSGKYKEANEIYKNETLKYLSEVQTVIKSINLRNRLLVKDKLAQINNEAKVSNTMTAAALLVGIVIFAFVFWYSFRTSGVLEKLKPFNKMFSEAALGDLTVSYPVAKVNCSEVMGCGNNGCPDFGRDGVLCWFDVGSFAPSFGKDIHCPRIINGIYKSCSECRVYKTVNCDEVESLGAWFNKFIQNVHDIISQVVYSSKNLSNVVQEISIGNQNLSQRTSEQAASIEEIASTIEEASATSSQNAENSIYAKKVTDEASRLAQEGGEIVSKAVKSIRDISESSSKIGEIISVINEIAFQTNLLALNAAVEAARAGDQGRGFAVVAGEVRNLAQRSANAAREIENLIKDSIEKVAVGTELSNKSGESLVSIMDSVKKVNELVDEIVKASEEQKDGINQINMAIADMDSVTQNNAAMVEETASASEEMAGLAHELLNMVKRFKIRDNHFARIEARPIAEEDDYYHTSEAEDQEELVFK